MAKMLLKRLLTCLATFVFLSFVIYQIMAFMPGDPVDAMVASIPNITAQDVARIKALYGLDQPGYVRFFNWFSAAAQGDFGYSRTYKVPVTKIISEPILNTFLLSIISLAIALIISVPLGVISAVKQNSKFDYVVNFFAFMGISIPSFWLGILLILIFAIYIPLLPAGGTQTVGEAQIAGFTLFLDKMKHLVLPVLSLTFFQLGTFVRYTRGAMLEVLKDDFIRTAKAKGASRNRVIFVHALRNALIPLVTVVSISLGYLFSGAIITETVFSYNGLGRLIYNSIMGNDYNVAMIGLLLVVAMVLIMNLVADLLYAVVDPRVSYAKPT